MSSEGHTLAVMYGFSLMVLSLHLHNTKLLFLCFSFGFSLCPPAPYFLWLRKNDNGAGPYLFRRHLKAFFFCASESREKKVRQSEACLIAGRKIYYSVVNLIVSFCLSLKKK